MAQKNEVSPRPPDTAVDPGLVRPRHAAADEFEQNPLSHVSERITLAAAEKLDPESRVREALRIVISEGVPLQEAARQCGVATSFLRQWRDKYMELLNEEQSVAPQPLMDEGMPAPEADLVRIPQAARDMFTENWRRLVERTRAAPGMFHQSPVRVFLENSWMTSWLYTDGQLDRGTAWGAAVGVCAVVLSLTFFVAGRFYRPDFRPASTVESLEVKLNKAAAVARDFFTADTLDAKFKLVFPGVKTRELMVKYYQNHPLSIPDAAPGQAWPHVGVYSLEFRSEALGRTMMLNVVERDGRMLVDWETSSLFQEAYIDELRKNRPTTPTMLSVKVQRADYYNFGFTAEKYSCYQLSYPGLQVDLFGYAAKGSAEEQTIEALILPITGGERTVAAILEVRYPDGANPAANQVQITKILQESWLKE